MRNRVAVDDLIVGIGRVGLADRPVEQQYRERHRAQDVAFLR